ncbi:MAG: hypothetical protein WAK20_09210 [Candidatus Acidiferrum sp.]
MNCPKSCVKNLSIAPLVSLLLLASSISAGPQSGQTNRELKMNVWLDSTEVGESKVPKFKVELQNVGEDDLILNLGIMLANGRKQYPKDIVLILTDSQGKARRLELREPFYVAGRVDPLILPLQAGSTFSIAVDLEKYWAAASNEFEYKLKPGTYFLEAQFSGRGLTQQEANLDVKGLALMPYWTGSITSNRLQFEFSGQ